MPTSETMRFARESAARRVRVPNRLGLLGTRETFEGEIVADVPLQIHTATKAMQAGLAYELKTKPWPPKTKFTDDDGEA